VRKSCRLPLPAVSGGAVAGWFFSRRQPRRASAPSVTSKKDRNDGSERKLRARRGCASAAATDGRRCAAVQMRICILQSSYEETNSVFKDVDPYANPAIWLKDHDCHQILIKKATAMQQIRDLAKENKYAAVVTAGFCRRSARVHFVGAVLRRECAESVVSSVQVRYVH
jgi:hypothetical protein